MKQMGDGKGNFLSAWGGISSLQFGMCNWLSTYSRLLIVWGAWAASNYWNAQSMQIMNFFCALFFSIFAVFNALPNSHFSYT
jgi:hypothetical protein